MKNPTPNRLTPNASGYSLDQAAKLAGISEALLILWIGSGRFEPSIELADVYPGTETHMLSWNRFILTADDVARLRKLVDVGTTVEKQHKPGTNWTVAELATAWNFSTDTIRDWFTDEPGILLLDRPETRKKRKYKTFTIPEDVAERVRRRRIQ